MSQIYAWEMTTHLSKLERIRVTDEVKELQDLLSSNPTLLPSDQIDPENPPKWLLVKREMPVPEPGTGTDKWFIDFLFVDQDGVPTFVECKCFNDPDSRRKVVGQMLDYVANGHYYWTAKEMKTFARSAALTDDAFADQVAALRGTPDLTVDEFFALAEKNLREAKLRIIFFLDDSPPELCSIVDFLNRQLENTSVLIVEARQYESDGKRIVVPFLFGYTEEARKAKSESRKEVQRASGDTGEPSFYLALKSGFANPTEFSSVSDFMQKLSDQSLFRTVYRRNCIFLVNGWPKRGLFAIARTGSFE